jgi:two-component system OmpR family response regulator
MKLLVVDDDLHIRRLIGIYLRDAGFDVTEAATGEEGLQAAQREAFDIVLIDLILPHYGGFRLCQKLKSAPAPPQVVITTGDDSPQSRNLAKESNADGFLAKPFTRDELLAAVRPSP